MVLPRTGKACFFVFAFFQKAAVKRAASSLTPQGEQEASGGRNPRNQLI